MTGIISNLVEIQTFTFEILKNNRNIYYHNPDIFNNGMHVYDFDIHDVIVELLQNPSTMIYTRRWFNISAVVKWDIVKNNPDKPWHYLSMSHFNKYITLDILKDNADKPWNYGYLSQNDHITWDIVKHFPGKPWDYSKLSSNRNITWEIIQDNPNLPWDFGAFCSNRNLTCDIVKNNPNLPWDYSRLSSNQNLTWDFVEGSQGSHGSQGSQGSPNIVWNWSYLSTNPSIFKLTDQDVKFLSSVRYIQDMWRNALYNPKYTICRKRIMREFNELGEI